MDIDEGVGGGDGRGGGVVEVKGVEAGVGGVGEGEVGGVGRVERFWWFGHCW